MKTMSMLAVLVVFATLTIRAQDAATALPANYRVQFENEWVKVTAVQYGPNEKLPGHAHTPNPSAYVYLNDGPPVIFRHVGGKAATRPATKAGAFRVYRGLEEVHEVDNTGSVPSEFLRVELKTEAREPGSFWGKFERPANPADGAIVHFNHGQVRISRVWLNPGQQLSLKTGTEPALVIALASGGDFTRGKHLWIGTGTSATLSNNGAAPIDFLRFDLKTPPAAGTR